MAGKRISRVCIVVLLAGALGAAAGCTWIDPLYGIPAATQPSGIEARLPKDSGPKPFPLGQGDVIEVTVYEHDELEMTERIDSSGVVFFPLVGEVQVIGQTPMQLRRRLTEGLAKYFVDPQVRVSVDEAPSRRVYVLGQVTRPSILTMQTAFGSLEAIAQAGGFTDDARRDKVLLFRGETDKPEIYCLDLQSAVTRGDFRANVALAPGDVIYVPRSIPSRIDRFSAHVSTFLRSVRDLQTTIILMPDVVDAFEDEDGGGGASTSINIQ